MFNLLLILLAVLTLQFEWHTFTWPYLWVKVKGSQFQEWGKSRVIKILTARMNKKHTPLRVKNDVTHTIQLKLHERMNKKQKWSCYGLIRGQQWGWGATVGGVFGCTRPLRPEWCAGVGIGGGGGGWWGRGGGQPLWIAFHTISISHLEIVSKQLLWIAYLETSELHGSKRT